MRPTPARWTSGGPHTLEGMRRALPARRVYHEWEKTPTAADPRLGAAFEETNPGVLVFEEETTLSDWVLPAIGLLVGGFFLGRWWAGRKAKNPTVMVGNDECGFDLLGATLNPKDDLWHESVDLGVV